MITSASASLSIHIIKNPPIRTLARTIVFFHGEGRFITEKQKKTCRTVRKIWKLTYNVETEGYDLPKKEAATDKEATMKSILSAILNFVYLILGVSDERKFPPPLTKEKETEYFERMKKGDDKARDLLIEHNLRLVSHIVRKYYASGKNQDDLLSVGTIGLIKAVDSFDYKNGARFATYGAKCIQNEILMLFRGQKKTACEVSINETIDMDKDGNPLTYIDIISVEDTIADDIDRKIQSKKAIDYINHNLDERERMIMILRYGLHNEPPITQREVAKKLGISRSYVSRIEKAVLERLCEYLS